MSGDAALRDASRRERALYERLVSVYRTLADRLAAADDAVDAAWLAERDADAETTSAELRALAGALAPARLTGLPVPEDVRGDWAESARLALAAARLNAEVAALARVRRDRLLAQLRGVGDGRRVLEAYRPAMERAAAVTVRRA